ncbi:hypothetical protein DFJ63DRAFT_183375 [Scheffersomyces coipomensis]|uniref:uncharacterized protein n=1 Tax=Scheffersomyces coipomensis TaxID=1788519 RepID=UPI00315D5D8E
MTISGPFRSNHILRNPVKDKVHLNSPTIYYRGNDYEAEDFNHQFTNDIPNLNEPPINLVLCLDGTENEFGVKPYSNVLKTFGMLEKDNPHQLCYYQPGIGVRFEAESNNYEEVNFVSSKTSKVTNKLDSIVAFSLDRHVIAAYNFLCRFYKRGDRIYLFGFSRGSFCARILAGMIERVGLLNKGLEEMTATAWELYSNWEYAGQPTQADSSVTLIQAFKETFSRNEVDIHFMGLWDTINSVGIIRDRLFPYTIRSAIVEHVRHAVSIDERRAKFKQLLFEPYSYYPHLFSLDCEGCDDNEDVDGEQEESTSSLLTEIMSVTPPFAGKVRRNRSYKLENLSSEDVIEMFFPGNHGDCGGGWPADLEGQFLGNIPLRWVISDAVKFGVIFKKGVLHEFERNHPVSESFLSCHHDMLALNKGHPVRHKTETFMEFVKRALGLTKVNLTYQQVVEEIEVGPRTSSYSQESRMINVEENNSSSTRTEFILPENPIKRFDGRGDESQISIMLWWLIELLPIGYKVEDKYGEWKQVYVPNLGRHRKIPKNCQLHWSFFYRLHYVEDYVPTNISDYKLGQRFIDSLQPFKDIYDSAEVEKMANDLTFEKIRNSWNDEIWTIIPDELKDLLDKYPDL